MKFNGNKNSRTHENGVMKFLAKISRTDTVFIAHSIFLAHVFPYNVGNQLGKKVIPRTTGVGRSI